MLIIKDCGIRNIFIQKFEHEGSRSDRSKLGTCERSYIPVRLKHAIIITFSLFINNDLTISFASLINNKQPLVGNR